MFFRKLEFLQLRFLHIRGSIGQQNKRTLGSCWHFVVSNIVFYIFGNFRILTKCWTSDPLFISEILLTMYENSDSSLTAIFYVRPSTHLKVWESMCTTRSDMLEFYIWAFVNCTVSNFKFRNLLTIRHYPSTFHAQLTL